MGSVISIIPSSSAFIAFIAPVVTIMSILIVGIVCVASFAFVTFVSVSINHGFVAFMIPFGTFVVMMPAFLVPMVSVVPILLPVFTALVGMPGVIMMVSVEFLDVRRNWLAKPFVRALLGSVGDALALRRLHPRERDLMF